MELSASDARNTGASGTHGTGASGTFGTAGGDCGAAVERTAGADSYGERMKSLDRGLRVLELLASRPEGLNLTELSALAGEKASTLHHVLSALRRRGFAAQDPKTRQYKLGVAALRIGRAAMVSIGFASVARGELFRLAHDLGETMTLAIREGSSVVYVDQVLAPRSIKMSVTVGDRAPLYCTASGKVFMAAMSDDEAEEFLRQARQKYTSRTVVDPQLLQEERVLVRQRGYALDLGEREEGLCCVAAPVFDHLGTVVAAISLSGPAERLDPQRLTGEIAPALVEAAARVSAHLGCRPLNRSG
ncbi:MAG TPA: IclR family transcriptional regulator [Firmicutes bacterium]|nr:IclR family transcriptional regulator [Bacillota bacterium]